MQPSSQGGISGGRFWASEQATGTAALASVFADAESVPPPAASDVIKEGRLVLRFTDPTGATLSVTESDESNYLCCYEPSSAWLSRSSPEATYYRCTDYSWLDLADTLVPLFALGWDLDYTPTTRHRQLTGDEHSNNERSPQSGAENERVL